MNGDSGLKWAPKVSQADIARLYASDALGFQDAKLADEVGYALYARCESIMAVTALHEKGELCCPCCARRTLRAESGFLCACGFAITYRDAHLTYKGKQLYGANATQIFSRFLTQHPACAGYGEKMLVIDRLIHEFHRAADKGDDLGRPVACNLIEGKLRDVLSFLARLSASPSQEEWLATVKGIPWIMDNGLIE